MSARSFATQAAAAAAAEVNQSNETNEAEWPKPLSFAATDATAPGPNQVTRSWSD